MLTLTLYLPGTPVTAIVANLTGYDEPVFLIGHYPAKDETIPVSLTLAPALPPVPPSAEPPTDPDGDGLHDDVNGNGRADFADVVLYFNQMTWIAANEPIAAFDFNSNGNREDYFEEISRSSSASTRRTPIPAPASGSPSSSGSSTGTAARSASSRCRARARRFTSPCRPREPVLDR